MRDRPYLSASEPPRPYSDIVAERNAGDVEHLARQRTLREIAAIEAEAAGLTDPTARRLRQLDAEELRGALEDNRRGA
jgi:hypothetical protein